MPRYDWGYSNPQCDECGWGDFCDGRKTGDFSMVRHARETGHAAFKVVVPVKVKLPTLGKSAPAPPGEIELGRAGDRTEICACLLCGCDDMVFLADGKLCKDCEEAC